MRWNAEAVQKAHIITAPYLFVLNMPHLRRTKFMIRFYLHRFTQFHIFFLLLLLQKKGTCGTLWSFSTLSLSFLWCTRNVSSYYYYLPQCNKHLRLILIFLLLPPPSPLRATHWNKSRYMKRYSFNCETVLCLSSMEL